MLAGNYSAWQLDPRDFDNVELDRRIAFLVRFAVLAPSSHNSQPWEFVVEPSAITVRPNMARALPQSDANHRQLYTSLGCAAENICQAADYYGYQVSTAHLVADGIHSWKISLTGAPKPASARSGDHSALATSRRHVNRAGYDSRLPDKDFLDRLPALAAGVRLHLISEEPVKSRMAAVVSGALIEAMDDTGFRRELSAYVLPNITKRMVGMPMSGFGMPTPLSFLAPLLVRLFNVNRLERRKDEEVLTKHTPLFVVLTTAADDAPAWFDAGRAFERIALEATLAGLSTGPMAASIQIGGHYRRLQEILHTAERPQVFFRLGYARHGGPLSPRLLAESVLAR